MPSLLKSHLKNKGALLSLLLFCIASSVQAHSEDDRRLFDYVNRERSRASLSLLEWDDQLYRLAQDHSNDMSAVRSLSHIGSDGRGTRERLISSGVYASRTGENIARDTNLVTAHISLMESAGHRENILNPQFTHGATAVVEKDGFLYVTQMFARLLPDLSVETARERVVRRINTIRSETTLPPIILSPEFTSIAQSRADEFSIRDSLTSSQRISLPGSQGKVRSDAYTCGGIEEIPAEVVSRLLAPKVIAGIGFRRIRNSLCEMGCYLITVISQ